MSDDDALRECLDKMERDGVAEGARATFADQHRRLTAGETGSLPEADIEPVGELADAAELPQLDDAGRSALDRVVVVKLNGGLGTSMGMTQAKSLLEVKDGLSFLDIIARQVLSLREQTGARVPLLLMDSFRTRDDSLAALARYADLAVDDLPLDFIQDKVPKIRREDLRPVEWPGDPDLEWAPPGHGNVYSALRSSGLLGRLLDAGYRYAFLSNADNLGATLDPRILAWMAAEELPFLSEVADRTDADRKGGHVAVRKEDGQLVLRETAQTPEEDLEAFQDVGRHKTFNTNNVWVDLAVLDSELEARDDVLGLPMIVNHKTVDPGDEGSTPVVQLETAMGAAIGVFEGARALRVSRDRFAPVKATSDLLVLRSDAYELSTEGHVRLAAARDGRAPGAELDDEFFKRLADFEERFAKGVPSLVGAERLEVAGDVVFGAGVTVKGRVRVEGPRQVEDGTLLE